ncbi:hypothetical protein ACH4E8_02170 [Streptomyces sp. NPDC017979]|uniref:hypothetical protein n=1 Tax=Streptomyces sp. NPDC017979 TaxID=3365024 RepID=UPI0037B74302
MDDVTVKGLLERAVEGSVRSGVTADGVFAAASKRRRRRRITATAVAAVVAATGVVGVPRLMDGQGEEDHRNLASMAGASMKFDTSKAGEKEAARLAQMLPPGRFDEVRKILRFSELPTVPTRGASYPLRAGAPMLYDEMAVKGTFVVRVGGEIGVIHVNHMPVEMKQASEFCIVQLRQDCKPVELPNGDEIATWRMEGGRTQGGMLYDSVDGVRSFDREADGKYWTLVSSAPGPLGPTGLDEPALSVDDMRSLLRDDRLVEQAPK